MTSIVAELRRRNVFKVAVAYGVVAWLLMQIVSVAVPALRLPDWTLSLITLLLIVGFPLALLFAWAYELTPEGLRPSSEVAPGDSIAQATGQKLNYIIAGLALGAVITSGAFWLFNRNAAIGEQSSAPIAQAPQDGAAAGPTPGQQTTETATAAATAPALHLTLSMPDGIRYIVGEDFVRSASISPDGRYIVFTGLDEATGIARLYLRPVDARTVTEVPGSEGGVEPFWSGDSTALGFYADGKIKTVDLAGGLPVDLANAGSTGGASWNTHGMILASISNPGPLFAIPVEGGAPEQATAFDAATEVDHDWPHFLEDGRHFLYISRGRGVNNHRIYAGALDSDTRTLLLEGVAAYAYAPPDRLVYLKNGLLQAQSFDTRDFSLLGRPVQLAADALAPISVSGTGALTYRVLPSGLNPMLWIEPDGTEIGEALPPGYYADPVISPDGTRLAYAQQASPDAGSDIMVVDLAGGAPRRLTLNPATDRAPVWSPDGGSIVFLSFRPEGPGLYRKNADGTGAEELILPSPGVVWPYQWTTDHLFYFEGVSGANDVAMMDTDDLSRRTPLIAGPYNEVDGALSPDGKWLVYTSNQTGRWELFLTSFPPSSTVLPVVVGVDPIWSADGSELYYVKTSTAELMAVSVSKDDPPLFGAPRRVHHGPLDYPSAHSIALHPDGDRILLSPSPLVQGDITVLINWESLLHD